MTLSNKRLEKLSNQYRSDKIELEDILLKQEAKINEIAYKVSTVDKLLKEKNKELKENESNCLQLVKIIEEQKQLITQFHTVEEKPNPKQITSVARLQNEIKCRI